MFTRYPVLRILLLATCAPLFAACGSSSSSDASGDVGVFMRDAEGDFLSYTVDVKSITLVRKDGAKIEVLPNTTRVDFSQYVDMSELFNLATIPAGTYVSAQMAVDFSNSDIEIPDASGAPVQATAVDATGTALTTTTFTLILNSGTPLTVTPGVPASLEIDFDLDSATSVVSLSPAKVRVLPILTAKTQLDTTRDRRLRGTLAGSSSAAGSLDMNLLPFLVASGSYGTAAVSIDSSTVFDIDGQVVTTTNTAVPPAAPNDAWTLLAAKAAGTPVVVVGNNTGIGLGLKATRVLVGTSVPWANRDFLEGAVLARSGSVLTVGGRVWNHANNSVSLHDTLNVDISATGVKLVGDNPTDTVTAASFSVGSRIQAFGAWNGTTGFDVTSGYAHRAMSQFTGTVTSSVASPLTVNLFRFNGRVPGVYTYTNTGNGSTTDANPASYLLNTGVLSLAGISTNDVVRVRGHVVDFGTASATDDFDATSIWDLTTDNHSAVFGALWLTSPVTSVTAGSTLPLNFAAPVPDDSGIRIAGITQGMPAMLTLTGASGLFVVRTGTSLQMYSTFTDWDNAIATAVGGGLKLYAVRAAGNFNSGTATFTMIGGVAVVAP